MCVCVYKVGGVTISLFDNGATFSCVSSCLEPCLVCFVAPVIVSGPGRRTSCIDRFTTTTKDFIPCRHICSMRLRLPLGEHGIADSDLNSPFFPDDPRERSEMLIRNNRRHVIVLPSREHLDQLFFSFCSFHSFLFGHLFFPFCSFILSFFLSCSFSTAVQYQQHSAVPFGM